MVTSPSQLQQQPKKKKKKRPNGLGNVLLCRTIIQLLNTFTYIFNPKKRNYIFLLLFGAGGNELIYVAFLVLQYVLLWAIQMFWTWSHYIKKGPMVTQPHNSRSSTFLDYGLDWWQKLDQASANQFQESTCFHF